MDVGTQLDYFRKEHRSYLRLIDEFEPALSKLASGEDGTCLRALQLLRAMEGELRQVASHCNSEERALDRLLRSFLDQARLNELENQHQEMRRLIGTWFAELRFATLDQTRVALGVGRQLGAFLRRHIAFEEELLADLERKMGEAAEQQLLLRSTQAPEESPFQ